jgi:hypothetical protein
VRATGIVVVRQDHDIGATKIFGKFLLPLAHPLRVGSCGKAKGLQVIRILLALGHKDSKSLGAGFDQFRKPVWDTTDAI